MPVRALLNLAAVALAVVCAGCFCIPWPRCTPMTCTEARVNCGEVPDGCGGVLDCGTCRAPETCGGFGTPNVCGCTPMSCAERGADCGVIDNCGEPLDCGTCTGSQTCGGGGRPNVCGCTPVSCASAGANCGSLPDGCGGVLDCGSCTPPWTCGGGVGGRPNVCGCNLTTCEDEGANCGTTLNDCAEPIFCGTCAAPETCGGGGTPNVCGCRPTTCAASGATCGVISDGCGGTLDCGPCPPRCGNGRLEAGEQCDDGNTVGGDLCDASCLLEAACPPVPDAPTTGLDPGTARGSVSVGEVPRTIDWSSAAFVPIRGTTQFQLIVSNDPRLCDTLANTNQYEETDRCPDDYCSLCPGCFGKRNGYAYLTARFEQSSPAGSAMGHLSFVDDQANVVGWGFRMAVDGAITPGSTALTGQLEICNAKYGAFGTGRFHATLCVGGLPINH